MSTQFLNVWALLGFQHASGAGGYEVLYVQRSVHLVHRTPAGSWMATRIWPFWWSPPEQAQLLSRTPLSALLMRRRWKQLLFSDTCGQSSNMKPPRWLAVNSTIALMTWGEGKKKICFCVRMRNHIVSDMEVIVCLLVQQCMFRWWCLCRIGRLVVRGCFLEHHRNVRKWSIAGSVERFRTIHRYRPTRRAVELRGIRSVCGK